jgi:hypothetical protein
MSSIKRESGNRHTHKGKGKDEEVKGRSGAFHLSWAVRRLANVAAETSDDVVDQRAVIRGRQVAPDQLGRDQDRQVGGLLPHLLTGLRGLDLDATFGRGNDARGLVPRLLFDFLARALGVGPARRDDAIGLDARLPQHLGGLAAGAFHLLARGFRPLERQTDALLPVVQRDQQRTPGELAQQRQQDQKREDRPDEQPWIRLNEWIVQRDLPSGCPLSGPCTALIS